MSTTSLPRRTSLRRTRRAASPVAAVAALALAAGACSTGGTSTGEPDDGGAADGTGKVEEVVLASHESWAMPKEVLAEFTRETGYRVKVQASGDAGTLTNKLVLTEGEPIADVAYGVDNTFASRAVEAGVFEDYAPEDAPASVAEFEMPDEAGEAALTPVDFGDVCVNVDDAWFAKKGIEPPATLDDLADPTYEGLFVTPGATTSSPGLAFLLATIAEYGEDGWQEYWERLMANGTRITSGWTDAYTVDFTAGGGGDRPIVLSYASSPPFTIPEGGDEPTTSALLDTCFRQVEYAGVLQGASNPEGARALVDFMVSERFQEALPENMYVFPVVDSAELPPVWAKWAKVPDEPLTVDPEKIAQQRDEWLTTWGEITTR